MQDNTFYIPENQQLAFDEQQKKKFLKPMEVLFLKRSIAIRKQKKYMGQTKKKWL